MIDKAVDQWCTVPGCVHVLRQKAIILNISYRNDFRRDLTGSFQSHSQIWQED